MNDAERVYDHRQVGWVILVSMALAMLLLSGSLMTAGLTVAAAVVAGVLVLLAGLFGTLRVTVDERRLRARFGVGLIGKTVALSEVRTFAVVSTPWYYGWGIRFIPGGVLYNVSGTASVELVLKGGERVRIGTDEPTALHAALVGVLGEPTPLTGAELTAARRVRARSLVVALLVGALIVAVVGGMMVWQQRPPEIQVSAEAVVVKSGLYSERMAWGDVTALSLEPSLPRILVRTNGYALGSTLRGHFQVAGMGDGQLFIDAASPPFIVVRAGERWVVVNDADPAKTREAFGAMENARGARR